MPDLHPLIASFSYLAIFVLMLTNGALNFPSSQFLYIICGYFVSTGSLLFAPVVIVGTLGNTLGNLCTFVLIKKYDKPLARKLLVMNEEMFDKIHRALHSTFSRHGMWYIFFGKLIPSVKAFIPILAGLAHTKTSTTLLAFLSASLIWATGITFLGYYFGEHVSLASLSGISLSIGAIAIYFVYSRISRQIASTQ